MPVVCGSGSVYRRGRVRSSGDWVLKKDTRGLLFLKIVIALNVEKLNHKAILSTFQAYTHTLFISEIILI